MQEDREVAAGILDQAGLLQVTGRVGGPLATHAQQVGDEHFEPFSMV
ncbi:MAG: hypothetical protein ACREV4_10395 [Gammaproteobacteria bacterium]